MKKGLCDIMELLRDAVEVFADKCSGDGCSLLAAYTDTAKPAVQKEKILCETGGCILFYHDESERRA